MSSDVAVSPQKRTFTPSRTQATRLSSSTRKPEKKKPSALAQFIRKVPSFSGRPREFYMNCKDTTQFVKKVSKMQKEKYKFLHLKRTKDASITSPFKEKPKEKLVFLRKQQQNKVSCPQRKVCTIKKVREKEVATKPTITTEPAAVMTPAAAGSDVSLCEQWKHQQRDLRLLRDALRNINNLKEDMGMWGVQNTGSTANAEPLQYVQLKSQREDQSNAQQALHEDGLRHRADTSVRVTIRPISAAPAAVDVVKAEEMENKSEHMANTRVNQSIHKTPAKNCAITAHTSHIPPTPKRNMTKTSSLPPFSPASHVGAAVYQRLGTHRTGAHHPYNLSTEASAVKQAKKMMTLQPAILDMHHDSYFSTTPQIDPADITSEKRLRAQLRQVDFDVCNEQPLFTAQIAQQQSRQVGLENLYLRGVFPQVDQHVPEFESRFGPGKDKVTVIENALILPPVTTVKSNTVGINAKIGEYDFSYLQPGYETNNTEQIDVSTVSMPVDHKLSSLIPSFHPMHADQDRQMTQLDVDSVRYTSVQESRAFLTFILQTLPYSRQKLRDLMRSKAQQAKVCSIEMQFMKDKLLQLSEARDKLKQEQKRKTTASKESAVEDEIDVFLAKMESRGVSLDKERQDEFNELIVENVRVKKAQERTLWQQEQQEQFHNTVVVPLTQEHEESMRVAVAEWEAKIVAVKEEFDRERRDRQRVVEQHNLEYVYQQEARDSKLQERIYDDVCSKKEESAKTVQFQQNEERRSLEQLLASQSKVDERRTEQDQSLRRLNEQERLKTEMQNVLDDAQTNIELIAKREAEATKKTLQQLKDALWRFTKAEYAVQREQYSLHTGQSQIDQLTDLLRRDNNNSLKLIQKWLGVPSEPNPLPAQPTTQSTSEPQLIQLDDFLVDADQLAELIVLLRDM